MERLRKQKDFQAVFEKGKKFFSPFFTVVIYSNDVRVVRLGVVAGLKVAKKAVLRNRLRRRIREAARTALKGVTCQKGYDIIILPKITALEAPFKELKQELARRITFHF